MKEPLVQQFKFIAAQHNTTVHINFQITDFLHRGNSVRSDVFVNSSHKVLLCARVKVIFPSNSLI